MKYIPCRYCEKLFPKVSNYKYCHDCRDIERLPTAWQESDYFRILVKNHGLKFAIQTMRRRENSYIDFEPDSEDMSLEAWLSINSEEVL